MNDSDLVVPQSSESNYAMDIIFEQACHLAADGGIASIHVVPNQRLAYDDLIRYRRRAEAFDLSFMVTKARGALGFRLFRRDPVLSAGAAGLDDECAS